MQNKIVFGFKAVFNLLINISVNIRYKNRPDGFNALSYEQKQTLIRQTPASELVHEAIVRQATVIDYNKAQKAVIHDRVSNIVVDGQCAPGVSDKCRDWCLHN